MENLIVAYPGEQTVQRLKGVLSAGGFQAAGVCVTGSQVLSQISSRSGGVIVSAAKFPDMMVTSLVRLLPTNYRILVLVSPSQIDMLPKNVFPTLTLPLNRERLYAVVQQLQAECSGSKKQEPKERTEEEKELIRRAKLFVMEKYMLSEAQAYRYIQKKSMNDGSKMIDTARILLQSGQNSGGRTQ